MKLSACYAFVFIAAAAFAEHAPIDLDPHNSNGAWLYYDNGTPGWVIWDSTYRGVWFNIQDFIPGMNEGYIWQAEFWFYHSTNYPWDTSDVYVELWNGDMNGPTAQIDQQVITAIHYTPLYVEYFGEAGHVEQNFWVITNVEMSAGGWPSTVTDWAGSTVAHSFMSDDLIVWEPFEVNGLLSNFFIRADWASCPNYNAFRNSTWGSLKATFQ